MTAPFTFQRGEDVRLFLAIVGDATQAAGVVQVSAGLKRALNAAVPPETTQPLLAFAVSRAPDGAPAGWYLSLTAAQTAALVPATYVTNAVLSYEGGGVEVTDPLFIAIQQSTAA